MKNISLQTCKNCGSVKFKKWEDLNDDEKFLVERLPNDTKISNDQRKKQRFCSRCFQIQIERNFIV